MSQNERQVNYSSLQEEGRGAFPLFPQFIQPGQPYGGYYEGQRPQASSTLVFNPAAWNSTSGSLAYPSLAQEPVQPSSQRRASPSAENVPAVTSEGTGKSSRWTERQTGVLIASWKENLEQVESARNAEAWQIITAEVNKAGGKKSLKQCRDKVRNLKMQYTKAKQHNKGTGNSPMYSPHYDELDEVLGIRAVVTMPGALQVGSQSSESSSCSPQQNDGQPDSESEDENEPLSGRKRAAADREPPAEAAPAPQKKKRARKTRRREYEEEGESFSPFQRQMLQMQERQLEMFATAEQRTEDLIVRLEAEQRKADQDARARDQDFLLRIAELFSKK